MRARTKENNTEANFRRLALGGQTVKNFRSLAGRFELDQSGRKSSQVQASRGRTESQVTPFGQSGDKIFSYSLKAARISIVTYELIFNKTYSYQRVVERL